MREKGHAHLEDRAGCDLEGAARALDQRIAAAGLEIWVGCEPTFTSRFSSDAAWTRDALGGDKLERAERMLVALARQHPGAAVLRPAGRQYPREPRPRWCFGIYGRRDGSALWSGPPDPLLAGGAATDGPPPDPVALAAAAARAAGRRGWASACTASQRDDIAGVVLRADGVAPLLDERIVARVFGPRLHELAVSDRGLVDGLAQAGTWVVVASREPLAGRAGTAVLELPGVVDPEAFAALLDVAGAAAREVGLATLILRGYPPPVDREVALTTLTPDPAVAEINHAPAASSAEFARMMHAAYATAQQAGLAPYRLHFDGTVADSGGAGHLTLGGPTPGASPFFREPRLLPRLVRYLNRHPALSYWFGPPYLGGSGQSARSDEGTREAFAELEIALARLDREPAADPALLARSLAPFLVDPSGNPHRSELNVEKLWNETLPLRGCLGLVELRAFGMARSAAVAAARACLVRALIAMLSRVEVAPGLRRWGDELHDRFALPFHLRQDLAAVAADLAAAGFALPRAVLDLLLADDARAMGAVEIDGCVLEVERAVEFWPLVGDVASQEGGGSRTVDASTIRLQLTLREAAGRSAPCDAWELAAEGWAVPLRDERDARGPLRVGAVRYRAFVPLRGLHPTVAPLPALRLQLARRSGGAALEVVVHGWRPDGQAYDGLPADLADAAARRRERVVARRIAVAAPVRAAPPPATSACCLDLRAL